MFWSPGQVRPQYALIRGPVAPVAGRAMLWGMGRPRRALPIGLGLLLALGGGPAAGEDARWGSFELLGSQIAPGQRAQLAFLEEPSFLKDVLDIPVFVLRGARPGPTLCVTAAIHGDEVNGVEIARHVLDGTDERTLAGTLVVLPFVNVWGFRSGNRYLPDRRDLNRGFPGVRWGSTAGRIAFFVFEQVIRRCDALVDLHTGSNQRTNLPQIRVDLESARARELALHFGVGIVVHGRGPQGSLRREATDAGIPAIIYEAGGPDRFEPDEIARGIEGVTNVMEYLEMLGDDPPAPDPQRVYRSTRWVRAAGGGIFLVECELGDEVQEGTRLGSVTDPTTSRRVVIEAPGAGTVIGMAHPQVVLTGFGLFHIGRREAGAEGP
jgi:predicted deacylase